MSTWPFVKLGSLADFKNGLNFSSENWGRGLKVIGVTDFQDYFYPRYNEVEEINPKGVVREVDYLEDGDVLFVRSNGNPNLIGRSLFIKKLPERMSHSGFTIRLRFTTDKVFRPFYVYLFKSSLIRAVLSIYGGGTNINNLNQQILGNLDVPLPPLAAQKKIAAILSAYEELIENNQRRGALLEKLAEEIYREWFVRLRFPGHEKAKVVKGVPVGWSVKRFHEIVEYYIGGGWGADNQSTSFCEGAFVIRGTDIPHVQAGEFDGCPFRFHKTSNLRTRKLQPNDFVFEVSGGSKDQLLGRNILVTERVLRFFDAPVIAASFCKQIRFRQELVSPYFMKYFLKLYYDYDLVGIYQVQSTGISNYQFESFLKFQTIILPPDVLQKAFDDKVKPIIEMQDDVALVNIALRKTRDLLLPRLISGRLSVEELDIQFPPSMAEELNEDLNEAKHA